MYDKEKKLEIFLEHHRFYSNRCWQYFGGILLINSIIFSSLDDLLKVENLITLLSIISVIFIGVFYHLINWTDMRIEENMCRIKKVSDSMFKDPETLLENTMNWLKFSILLITLPYFYFLLPNKGGSSLLFALILMLFIIILTVSERTRKKFEKRLITQSITT